MNHNVFFVLCSVFYVYVSLVCVEVMSVSAVIGLDILLSMRTVFTLSLYVLGYVGIMGIVWFCAIGG